MSSLTSRCGRATLLVILLLVCLVMYFCVDWNTNSKTVLGVTYYYTKDSETMIVEDLERIHDAGFPILCIPLEWSSNPSGSVRVKTSVLLTKAKQLGLDVYVREGWSSDVLQEYLNAYGDKISYVQVVNEADARFLKEWLVPGQLVAMAEKRAQISKSVNSNIKTVASFATPFLGTLIRSIAEHVDIIALDIYERIQLHTFPLQTQTMLTLSDKYTLWIGELGYASLDDKAQADFLVDSANLCSLGGVDVAIIYAWKEYSDTGLSIEGRLAETELAKWIG